MKSYLLYNDFVSVVLDNYTDLNIDEVSKYFYNYIKVSEVGKEAKEEKDKLVLKYEKDFYDMNNSTLIYSIDNHKLIQDGKSIILSIDNNEDDILFLKRFIIDYINRIIERNNSFFLHGSSVIDGGQSIIFTGEKMSGKTTNMLQMLDKYNFSYSSNEKVAIIKNNNSLYSYGCPSNINVRVGTLKYNSNLLTKLSGYINSLECSSKLDSHDRLDEERIVFSANDIIKAFNTDIKPSGKIKCICNLTFLPEVDFSIRELTVKEKLIVLKRSLISGIYPTRRDILEEVLPVNADDRIDCLESLRCYNICHNNKNNNVKKILDRIKEDVDDNENDKSSIEKIQNQRIRNKTI